MARVGLVGVPFDGYGRPGNQASASAVLREAGLLDAFAAHHVVDTETLDQRDRQWRRQFNVGTLRDLGVFSRAAEEVAGGPRRRHDRGPRTRLHRLEHGDIRPGPVPDPRRGEAGRPARARGHSRKSLCSKR